MPTTAPCGNLLRARRDRAGRPETIFLWLLLIVGAALGAPAHAGAPDEQEEPGRRIPTWEQSHLLAGHPRTTALYMLGVCARIDRAEAVEALLRSEPGSPDEREAISRVLPGEGDRCLTRLPVRRLTIRNPALLRGAVAEALYNGAHIRPRSDATLPGPLAGGGALEQGASPRSVGRAVAFCAVRQHPRLAHRVMEFVPGAIGEGRALRALTPVFLACLPEGESLRVSRLAIRAHLAEALLHASRSFRDSFINA